MGPPSLEAVKRKPLDEQLWNEIIYAVKEHGDNLSIAEGIAQQLDNLKNELKNLGDDELLKNLPEVPTEDDLYFLVRQELSIHYAHQVAIAYGQTPPLEVLQHRLAQAVNLIALSLMGGGPLMAIVGDIAVGKLTQKLLAPVDRWNRQKSQLIVAALSKLNLDAEDGFFDRLSELISQRYGPTLENLGINSLGMLALANTIIEDIFMGVGADPELVDRIKSGKAEPVQAFIDKLTQGTVNYPVMTRDLIFYDSKDIVAGVHKV